MNNQAKSPTAPSDINYELQNENNHNLKNLSSKSPLHLETEKKLNSDILSITLLIKEQYPELSKYLEEMTVTIPDEDDPAITLRNLQSYYDSLVQMVSKYQEDHPSVKK